MPDSRIRNFEDLVAWQKARELARRIYGMTKARTFSRDLALVDQMRRAVVSIGSNIAEGFERARPNDFHNFLSIAKGSCAELRSQLYVALDAGYISLDEFEAVKDQAIEVGRLIGSLRASIKRTR